MTVSNHRHFDQIVADIAKVAEDEITLAARKVKLQNELKALHEAVGAAMVK